jgi:serine protease inhibitor
MSYELVELNLPKFVADTKYSLREGLIDLGLDHMFNDEFANFSRMTSSGNFFTIKKYQILYLQTHSAVTY